MKAMSKSPLRVPNLNHSYTHNYSNCSARDRSPGTSLEQAIADRLQAINELQ